MSFLLGKFAAREQEFVPTSAPVAEDLINEWSGASMADVEAFCLEVDRKRAEEGDDFRIMGRAHLFVVLDEEGLNITGGGKDEGAQGTCILAQRKIDWDAEPLAYPEKFDKARLPWCQIYLTWCNLVIGNMGWDDFITGEEQRDG